MFKESKLPYEIRWVRDKIKWIILPLAPVLPIGYFFALDRYVRIKEYYIVDGTPPAVRVTIAGCFWLMLALGLITIPRWYSFVAFAALAAFMFIGMTCYP